MAELGISSLLVTRRENIRYLTGFTGSAGVVVLSGTTTHLITDFRYKVQAAREAAGVTIRIQKNDWIEAFHELGRRIGMQEVWYDESSLTGDTLRKLRAPSLKLMGRGDVVTDLRKRKDQREIQSIRTALRRAERSFRDLAPSIRPGVTEQDLALQLEFLMRRKGARRAAFDIIVASGGNGAMPHASVTNRRLRRGDLVTFDFGAEADGYFCDLTRTLCVGSPDRKQREIHELVQRAQQAAIDAIGPGVACSTVDAAARDIIAGAGYGDGFGHGTGHGVGLMVHEAPRLSPMSKDVLEQGMVVTIEPGVYIPGWGGVRIEDMVLVSEQGAKVLSSLSRGWNVAAPRRTVQTIKKR
ncbi:MAG: hypothetical protein A2072_02605 [Nitrospirae bacterium GWC1_57_7]|nr:MAG: hypothetical protein A2072_02605 [Nitrospirae bacterium GWC1_57_7]OGW43214.1 MAG: hypothetical protein A2X57_04430 [Nitrospirae bacterium GWD2_57_8]